MSAENSWSRKTVRPSFSDSWNQSRQVTRLPVQLWKYSCATTLSMPPCSRRRSRCRAGQHELGVEDVEALVLHRAHVEVADGDDHEHVEVVLAAVALLVPAHRALQAEHGVPHLSIVARLDEDLQRHLAARRVTKLSSTQRRSPATSANR
jgi:hypothetical protein